MNFNETVGSIVYDFAGFTVQKPKNYDSWDADKKAAWDRDSKNFKSAKDVSNWHNNWGKNHGKGGGKGNSGSGIQADISGSNIFQNVGFVSTPSSPVTKQRPTDVTTKDWKSEYQRISNLVGSNQYLSGIKLGGKYQVSHLDKKGNRVVEERTMTQDVLDKANRDLKAYQDQLGILDQQVQDYKDYHSKKHSRKKSKLESAVDQFNLERLNRANDLEVSAAEVQRARDAQSKVRIISETGTKIAEDAAKASGYNLEKAKNVAETNKVNDSEADRQQRRKQGTVAYYMGKLGKNIGGYTDNVGNIIGGAADAWTATTDAVKAADRRIFTVDRSKLNKVTKLDLKKDALLNKAASYEEGSKEQDKYLRKAERAEEKANEKYETARAQKRADSFKTAGNVFGSIKDTLSSKSRARTLAERGQAGVKRREAQIAYAMGDHSFFTKLAAGKSFGSKNAFTRAIGKIPGWMVYGRKENKARKNYATQLSYGGFSVGADMAQTMIHDFSDFDDLMEQTTGEGWQYREYPELAKILDDDKYEKLDQKVMESGEFSEGEGETPPDGIIDSDSLRPGREEVTINDILSKNYYTASPVEKKFQEMIARGFSESNSNPYENFLQSFSDNADTMRMM